MIRKALGLLTLAGGIALIACGEDEPAAKYPSVDSFCAAKAAEECKVVSPICAITDQVCNARRTDACKSAANAALAQGRVYTAAKADACIAKTTEAYKDRVVDPVKEEALKEACERVFTGVKKLSEPCTSLYECEGSLVCDLDKGPVCATKVEKKKDEPCNNPGDICNKGLYCQQRGSVKFCTDKNRLDESCNPKDAPCMEDLRCTNKCVPLQKAGEPCDTNDECVTRLCNADRKCGARQYPSETGTCKDFGG